VLRRFQVLLGQLPAFLGDLIHGNGCEDFQICFPDISDDAVERRLERLGRRVSRG